MKPNAIKANPCENICRPLGLFVRRKAARTAKIDSPHTKPLALVVDKVFAAGTYETRFASRCVKIGT